MKTITELSQYIRFQLSQLRIQNQHHEFEHLTRQFARLRICENILPATGPVGVGGDQGRDFESYRTYIQSTPIAVSTFFGTASTKKIVFACSLKQNIIPKIKSDVSTICSGPKQVDAIYYFCEPDVPVAKRHIIQSWCQKTFGIELVEIFDGQALSEQLTDLDVFWIAEEYLDVPSELYPRSKSPGSRYEKYRERWLTSGDSPRSFADFFQVKFGLRRATFNKGAKPDLRNWMKIMEAYLEEGHPQTLQRRASYEICVAALRGLNNLTEKKELIEKYFSDIEILKDISDFQDATVLLSYCSSAYVYGHFTFEVGRLSSWTKSLITKIEDALENAIGYGTRCRLLQIRGQASLLQFRISTSPEINLEEAFDWWFKLLKEIENAPLFPLEDFADLLTIIAKVAGDNERFLELTQTTDELLTNRSSGYIAAEKCRDRAIAYYEIGQYLTAIKQLHQSKIKWFSAETLRGSLMSMLLLSNCYQKLGLVYAAKYYAAGVAFLAHHDDEDNVKRLIPKALFMFAELCYFGGEWLTFGHVSELALVAHNIYDEHPLDFDRHTSLQNFFAYTAIIRTVTKRFAEDLFLAFDELFQKWPIDLSTREAVESLCAGESGFWQTVSPQECWKTAQEDLAARPFCDVGQRRGVYWKALGISWAVEFDNEYLVSSISEELVSTLQIILADLAPRDLLLLPTRVLVNTLISKGSKFEIQEIPSNEVATWRVKVPEGWIRNTDKFEELRGRILALAVIVLANCSMLDYKSFREREIERSFSEGLSAKTFSVRPYAELYSWLLQESESHFPARKLLCTLLPSYIFNISEHGQLAWVQKDGQGYSRARSEVFLENRYKRASNTIRLTLPRLLRNEQFASLTQELRQQGYLDWEVLVIVANICIDYRIKQMVGPGAPLETQARILAELYDREEQEYDPEIPPAIFTKERFEIQKRIVVASIAKTWGLEIHHQTPDFEAIARLLDVRYHNSEDDIPHQQMFRTE